MGKLVAVVVVLMLLGLSGCEHMRGQDRGDQPIHESPTGY